tara:strand:- start:253 stop:570 length:318 start_codon:yes stop_codon:yes gene_type:complete
LTQDPSGRSNTVPTVWHSTTVKFGWNVDGIFPKGEDGSFINAVSGNPEGDMILTGDDFGNVRIFRDPVRKGSKCRTFKGHSSFVTNVLIKGDRIFSAGGEDKTVF